MREQTSDYQINGRSLLEPDYNGGVSYSWEDIDAADAGRDESGTMQRNVVRYKVGKWDFSWGYVTEEEYQYILSLLPESPTFTFRHPKMGKGSEYEDTTCYCSKCSVTYYSKFLGVYKDLKLNIIEV